jgi:hypothetical protein
MYRSLFNRYGARRERRRWPRSRAGGCLLWVVLLIVILIVLSVMFGGFQKGTKSNGLAPSAGACGPRYASLYTGCHALGI